MLRRLVGLREWIIAGAAMVGAVGTVAAVAYALYRDTWREKRHRPHLSLYFDPSPSPSNLDVVTAGKPVMHWARLRVENEPGRRTAEEVEVLVLSFRPIDGKGALAPLNGRLLPWVGLRSSDMNSPVTRTHIPAGIARRVDLLSVSKTETGHARGRLEAIPTVEDGRASVNPGRYIVELAVAARDIDAVRFALEVHFDGSWSEGPEVWNHIRISPPQEV
jgi:hypothetical protein